MKQVQNCSFLLRGNVPDQASPLPLFVLSKAVPDDSLGRVEFVDAHSEEGRSVIEAELGDAANPGFRYAIPGPPAAESLLRCDCLVDPLRGHVDFDCMMQLSHGRTSFLLDIR